MPPSRPAGIYTCWKAADFESLKTFKISWLYARRIRQPRLSTSIDVDVWWNTSYTSTARISTSALVFPNFRRSPRRLRGMSTYTGHELEAMASTNNCQKGSTPGLAE